jgi:hypothetical protein
VGLILTRACRAEASAQAFGDATIGTEEQQACVPAVLLLDESESDAPADRLPADASS